MRRDITLDQAMRYKQLMEGTADVVCLKVFDYNGAQAVYNGRKTTPDITFVGTNEYFINANQYSIDLGRNLQAEDIELGRPVVVIGQDIVKKLFPSENPAGQDHQDEGAHLCGHRHLCRERHAPSARARTTSR